MPKKIFIILAVAAFFAGISGARADHIPVISNVRVENIISTGAQIKWTTDIVSDSRSPFGSTSGHQSYTRWVGSESDRCDGGGYVTSHCLNLTGLTVGTTYYYKVESMTSAGYDTHYGECNFTAGSGGTATCTTGTETTYDPGGSPASVSASSSLYTTTTYSANTSNTLPATPTALAAVLGNNYVSVNLTWTDNSSDETYFELFWRKAGESYWQYFAGASANSTYAVHNNPGSGSLEYAIKACNNAGCSPESNAVSVNVPVPAKKLTGSVKRPDGSPVTDAGINVYKSATGGSVYGETDASGNYAVYLTGGSWEVFVNQKSPDANWTYNQSTQIIIFAVDDTNETKTINFTVTTVDAKVKGRVIKPDGTFLTPDKISVWLQGSSGSGFGASFDNLGNFSAGLPAGTYRVYINVNDPLYSAPAIPDVTVATGETKDLGTITLVSATKTIKGKVARVDGSAVTDARVNVYIPATGSGRETQTDQTGNYTLSVTGGIWEVHVYPLTDAAKWYYGEQAKTAVFAADTSVEIKTVDFIVTSTDSEIQGKILKPDGTPPASKTVSVDIRSSSGQGVWAGVDDIGNFRAKVSAGIYNIYINVSDPLSVAPTVNPVTVTSGTTKDLGTITLVKASKT
ncbi:MAG: carboxypeptidase-like regulatory domain-containing protein, partial [Patescibacteria group bacterium]